MFSHFSSNTWFKDNSQIGRPHFSKSRLGKGRVHHVKYFPDGKRLAVASSIGIWIYNVETGQALDLLTEHTGPIKSIVFSPDCKTFATGSTDKTIRLWDTNTYECKSTLFGHENEINLLTFSPNGENLASRSEDNTIRFWDVQSGNLLKTIDSFEMRFVSSMAYSTDGKKLLTFISGNEGEFALWDTKTGECLELDFIEKYYTTTPTDTGAYSPDRSILVCGGSNPIQFCNAETGEFIRGCTEHIGQPASIEFSPDGQTLVSGNSIYRFAINIWEVSSGKLLRSIEHADSIRTVAYSPDGKTIVSGSDDGTVRLWEVSTGELIKTITGHMYPEIFTTAFSPDGNILIYGSDYELEWWNPQDCEHIKTSAIPNRRVHSVNFSYDGKMYAIGGENKKVRLWDVQTGRFLGSFIGQAEQVSTVAFSPDGNLLATGGNDKQVCLWEIRTGEQYLIGDRLATFTEHSDNVTSVVFSADGKTLASGSQDETIQIWDMDTRTHLKTLTGHDEGVTDVVFSPDGTTLASGSQDGTIRLWNTDIDSLVLPPIEGAGHVTSLDYSPDGSILASGSEDGNAIYIWDAKSGHKLHTFTGHTQRVNDVVFSSDGKTLASVSSDGTAHLWDTTTLKSDQ